MVLGSHGAGADAFHIHPFFGALVRVLDWPTGFEVNLFGPVHVTEFIRGQHLAGCPVNLVGEAVAVKVHQDLVGLPVSIGRQVNQDAFVDAVIIPGIVWGHLIRPLGLARIRVAGKQRHRPLVVTRPLVRIPGARISGAIVEQVKFGVVAIPAPGRAPAALPLLTFPGGHAKVFALVRLVRRRKVVTDQDFGVRAGAIRPPDLLTRVDMIRRDKPAHAKLTPTHARDDFVTHDQRHHGNGLALFDITLLDLPQLFAGLGIKGDGMGVELIKKDLAGRIGRAPIHHIAAGNRNGVLALYGRVFPFNGIARVGQINGIHDIRKRGHNIHGVADNQRRAFMPAQDAGRKRPGDFQALHILRGDLVQAAVASEGIVSA